MNRARALVGAAWLATVLGAGSMGFVAARVAGAPATVPTSTPGPAFVTVVDGTVGRSLDLVARVTWPTERQLINGATGVVTKAPLSGVANAKAGAAVYWVDLRPVVALRGTIPAFRDLREGDTGADVTQLQAALADLGHDPNEHGGAFGWRTRAAVRAWQRSVGLPADGVLSAGSVLYLPTLPATVRLSEEIATGRRLVAGSATLEVLAATPRFELVLSRGQQSLVPLAAEVVVDGPSGHRWTARMGEPTVEGEETRIPLTTGDPDQAVCRAQCAELPPRGDGTVLAAHVVLVPEVSGPTVPSAAIRRRADGTREVVTQSGAAVVVQVRAEAGGRAVVSGLTAGDRVVLFAPSAPPTPEPSGQ